jgi:hypothetical protein
LGLENTRAFRAFRAFRYRAAGGAGASFRVNSALLLRYQIVAPLKMTASKTISVSSMPKQDFIGSEKRCSAFRGRGKIRFEQLEGGGL